MTGPSPFTLPPVEAIKWFREKGYALSFDYRDLYGKEHARAFTVAKATQLDLLGDIRSALDKALAKGMTLQEFTRQLRPELQRRNRPGSAAFRSVARCRIVRTHDAVVIKMQVDRAYRSTEGVSERQRATTGSSGPAAARRFSGQDDRFAEARR